MSNTLTPLQLARNGAETLVTQIVRLLEARMDDKLLRTGARMPSIRQFSDSHGISRFTVVEAYDRLVAKGFLESRRGSGFYVRDRTPPEQPNNAERQPAAQRIDTAWLVRNMCRQMPPQKMPGSGLLPADWLDGKLISSGLRALSQQSQSALLGYGTPQGFLPLRQQLQLKLAELDIAAGPDQIIMTNGVTQGLDIVARHLLHPGDVVFVDDPAWYLMFGSFAAMGATVIGIPRLADGPDIAHLTRLAARHKPKLYVINSVLHNPSSSSLSAANAFQILKLAEQHDFTIVEDDVYCDMHPGATLQATTRLATLDQLHRVIYLGGFSKTLAANLRIGFIASAPALARHLADRKMLSTFTTSEIGERIVYKVLSEGHYRKHTERLRNRLDQVRENTTQQLEALGLRLSYRAPVGMFAWVDTGIDSNLLAEQALAQGYLLAPGSLFSPQQLPSSMMRFNVTCMNEPGIWRFLEQALNRNNKGSEKESGRNSDKGDGKA